MELSDPIIRIKGVGDELSRKMAIVGVKTVGDLINYLPRRYDDYSDVQKISQIKPGAVTIQATIKQVTGRYSGRGLHITEAVASDDSGSVRLIWFNQPYRAQSLRRDQDYFISGEFALSRQRLSIANPSIELVSEFPVNTARIVPIYSETKGLKSGQIRRMLKSCLPSIRSLPETLPAWLLSKHKLLSFAESIEAVHFPPSVEGLKSARHRLGFEEVFELTLAALHNKYELQQEVALTIPFDEKLAREFVGHLPFSLTDDQRKVIWRLYQDMQRTIPMNRLVEGDVGSGKTVVAVMTAVMAMRQGFQVAMMAPTELLARQHAETVQRLLKPLGLADGVCLLVGSLKPAQKKSAQEAIRAGHARFIVGTHALIQEKVDMHNLGLIVIDEQHRFGVDSRKALQLKAGHALHVLSMTATPIPRSLALTLYGEMDISIIGVKPLGRKPIITKICSPNSRAQLHEKIRSELEAGRQMFVVCPLITDSEALEARSAEAVFEEMSKKSFKDYRVGLLHGKLKPADKDAVMKQFVDHELDILVSTTVIEVGVDVPNATVMLVENAERFGLAQIHQLRGRVGRSDHQGYCYLMLGAGQQPSRRLRALESSSDGFALAELDLSIRGPGAIYGRQQHGPLDLRIAELTDVRLIAEARTAAQEFIDKGEDLLQYPHLAGRVKLLRAVTNLN